MHSTITETVATTHVVMNMNPVFMASLILVLSYLVLFTEKVNSAVVALIGGAFMVFSGIINEEQAFEGVDFNTLSLLIGMMSIVGIAEKSGIFQYVAIWSAKKVRANPRAILAMMIVITALFSAFLDNVTTVLLIVPVTFLVCEKLEVEPYPFIVAEIFASNIGGTATLIGDPPNIIIGSAAQLSFTDFMFELGPLILFCLAALIVFMDFLYGRKMISSLRSRAKVMMFDERDSITDKILLIKSLVIIFLVICGFVAAEHIHIQNGTIAMFGAAVLLMLYVKGNEKDEQDKKVEAVFAHVDWTTIFFFAGLFVIVTGFEQVGLLEVMGQWILEISKGSLIITTMALTWISAIVSSVINNIPFVATMIPMINSIEPDLGGREAAMPLWWALSLGACLGGNGTLVGASANVMVAGMAQRMGYQVSFGKFLILSLPVMLGTMVLSTLYLYIRHFM